MNRVKKGFTLIELLLYLGLSSLILSAVVSFAWRVIGGRVKASVQLEVAQNIRYISNRIEYEIKNATEIVSVSTNRLELASNEGVNNPTIIELVGDKIKIGQGNGGDCPATQPCIVTSNRVSAVRLEFKNLSSALKKNIKYTIQIDYKNGQNNQRYQQSKTIVNTVSLRSK